MPDELLAGQVAPVQNEAAQPGAAQEHAADTSAFTDGAGGGEESGAQKKTFTQEELDDIVRKRIAKAEAKAERRVLRTLERLQGNQQPQPQQTMQQQANDGRPTQREGESVEAFVDRLTDWKLEQREQKVAQSKQQEQAQKLLEKTERIYAEASKLQGFDRDAFDALADDGHLTKSIVEALIDSDNAPGLMKFMADNPEEVERIARLSPARQAAELGKLEAKVSAAPKKTTSAPAPFNPVRQPSGSAKTYDTTDPRAAKELSTSEWIAADQARLRKKFAGNA